MPRIPQRRLAFLTGIQQISGLMRVVCFLNGVIPGLIAGGDIYFSHIARAAAEKHTLHFIGARAARELLQRQGLPDSLTTTDNRTKGFGNMASLPGQFRMLWYFTRRFLGTLPKLGVIRPDDVAYTMTDYWFDVVPMVFSRARAKICYLGMTAPTLGQILRRDRADIPASRLASIYYWGSQQISLRLLRLCKGRHVTYSHPEMKAYLMRFGYQDSEMTYVANGMDLEMADRIKAQPKEYDVVWTGRPHVQKGINDLLAAIEMLSREIPDFKALIIGRGQDVLEPKVREMNLSAFVEFSGLVSEEEKFRLLKASRVFAMPSRYESWGIVVGEALAAGVPVVAYDLSCYRPVFGDFVRYIQSFDVNAFIRTLKDEVLRQRAGENYLASLNLEALKRQFSWNSARQSFSTLLDRIEQAEERPTAHR